MRPAQPDLQNLRIIRLARQIVSLPFVVPAALYRWVKGRLQALQSDKTLRENDQARQSRARRELRGLPPDHDDRRMSPNPAELRLPPSV